MWPSCKFGAEAFKRLQDFDHDFDDQFVCYPGAGHDVSIPGNSTYERSFLHPHMGVRVNMGGSPKAAGMTNRSAYEKIVNFVR